MVGTLSTILNEAVDDGLQDAIADRRGRIRRLADRAARLRRVIEERAADEHFQQVPGGSTGLLRRQPRMVGSGDSTRVVWDYQVDAPLLKELRAHERQAAQELGQWNEKRFANEAELDAAIEKFVAKVKGKGPDVGSA